MSGDISQKQLEANRHNAQLSTGPKTPEGKRRVRWNALKHGLLARSVVVPSRNRFENRNQFEALLTRLHDELRPVGILEEMLVEKIAVAYWRLRRAVRAEAGEISENLRDSLHYHYQRHSGTLALPSKGDTYKIMRYETTIERQLHKAVEQLQRLQNQRKRGNTSSRKEMPIQKN